MRKVIVKISKPQMLLWCLGTILGVIVCISCTSTESDTGQITDGYAMTDVIQSAGYEFSLWRLPLNPVIGSVQFGIGLLNDDGTLPNPKPILDIYVTPLDGEQDEEAIKTRAISTPRNPQFYEGMIEFEIEGDWEIEIRMSEPIQTSVFTTVNIAQRNRSGGTLAQGTIFFFSVQMVFLVILAGVFYRARRRSNKIRKNVSDATP